MTYLETGVYQLSTLSPIHIRAGADKKYGQGFIRLDQKDDCLYIVDTPKLQAELWAFGGLQAAETYTEAFSNPNRRTNIVQVLDKIGYNYKSNITKISKGIVRIPSGNRFMQSGLGQHFVPGSSIKGAIKTAVLHDNVKKRIAARELNLDAFVERQIEQYQRQMGGYNQLKFRERFAEQLLRDAFQSKHPREHHTNNRRTDERTGPFKDLFKSIKVKDAIIKETSIDTSRFAQTVTTPGAQGATLKTLAGDEIQLPFDNLLNIINQLGSLKRGEWVKIESFEERDGTQVVATCTKIEAPTLSRVQFEDILFTTLSGNRVEKKDVGDNTRFECFHGETTIEISIDHEILDSFKRGGANPPFSDVNSLVQLCRNFAQAQWEAEQKFLAEDASGGSINLDAIRTFYNDEKRKRATLRIGWGTGMLGTTVSLLLDEETRVKLRNDVISADRQNRPRPAPKSRRFILENEQPIYPLGWIQLSRINHESQNS
jgi:CRISPR/Cas system CSM-associated protein Csm5 (group 7 of RAMP superfamily)